MDNFPSPLSPRKGLRSPEVGNGELFLPPPPCSPPDDDDFDTPLATSEQVHEDSGASEDELDFTDADAAIDAMLDDLQIFQKVSCVTFIFSL